MIGSSRSRAVALAALVVLSAVGMPVAAASAVDVNTSSESYPSVYVQEDELTKATHEIGMDALEYESNSGELTELEAIQNGTESGNDQAFRADRVAFADAYMFPRTTSETNNSASVMDASEWTTSSASISEADGSTGENVEAITFSTSGITSGSSGSASYTNLSETDDPNKRILQVVMNVESLDAGATAEVALIDGDGDEVSPEINSSADASAAGVIANATGNGVIYQHRTGDLAVEGSGDGSLDGIQEVELRSSDGDATVTITALNAERKSAWDFGTHRYEDADGNWQTETIEERPEGGEINVTSVESMGDTFSNATVSRLTLYDLRYRMADQPDDFSAEFVDASDTGGYDTKLELKGRINVETAYDLTHGDLELVVEQALPGDRFQTIRYAEGVGDTSTSEISDSSWVDVSGDLGEEGTTVTADATGQSGVTYAVDITALVLPDEVDSLENVGGGGGFWGSSSGGGPFSSAYNWIVGGVVGLLTTIGLLKRGS
jgi:hypothetical protein